MLNDHKQSPKVMLREISGKEGTLENERILLPYKHFKDRD